jgi:hypothetical protein
VGDAVVGDSGSGSAAGSSSGGGGGGALNLLGLLACLFLLRCFKKKNTV